MALSIVGNLFSVYKQHKIESIYMTDAEAAVAGTAYKLSSGRWTKATDADRIYAICIKSASAGTDVPGVMVPVCPGDIIEADYTGTPDATFLPGLETASLDDTNGNCVDAADVTGGHLIILEKDTDKKKVRCIAAKCFTHDDTVSIT